MTFFHYETLNIQGIEGKYLSVIKNIYEKSKANIILNSEHLKSFPLIRNKIRLPTPTLIQFNSRSSSQSNQVRKRIKRHPKQKGRSKLFIFYRRHDFFCTENLTDSTTTTTTTKSLNQSTNSVKFQDTKSLYRIQFHFCVLIMKHLKKKLSRSQQHQKQEIN